MVPPGAAYDRPPGSAMVRAVLVLSQWRKGALPILTVAEALGTCLTAFLQAETNIHFAYPLLIQGRGCPPWHFTLRISRWERPSCRPKGSKSSGKTTSAVRERPHPAEALLQIRGGNHPGENGIGSLPESICRRPVAHDEAKNRSSAMRLMPGGQAPSGLPGNCLNDLQILMAPDRVRSARRLPALCRPPASPFLRPLEVDIQTPLLA